MKRHVAVAALVVILCMAAVMLVLHILALFGYSFDDVPETPMARTLLLAWCAGFCVWIWMAQTKLKQDRYDEDWPPLVAPTPERSRAVRWLLAFLAADTIVWTLVATWAAMTAPRPSPLGIYATMNAGAGFFLGMILYVACVITIGYRGVFPRWRPETSPLLLGIGYLSTRFSSESRTRWRRNRRKANRRRALNHAERMAHREEWPR